MGFLLSAQIVAALSTMLASSPDVAAQAVGQMVAPLTDQIIPVGTHPAVPDATSAGLQNQAPLSANDDAALRAWSRRMVRPCVRTGARMVC